jgi:hypothetical protein
MRSTSCGGLAARTDQGVHLGLQNPVRHVGVDPVVDGEVARGANRPDKVDRHLAAQPGRGRRAEQYIDRHSGLGECVARVWVNIPGSTTSATPSCSIRTQA